MKRFALLLVLLTAVAYSEETEVIELSGMTIIGNEEPVAPTHNLIDVDVHMVWYETKEELNRIYQRTCNDVIQPCEKSVLAFTRIWPEDKTCEIHAMIPELVDKAKMKVLGHEFSHCLFGAFHE